MSDPQTPPRGTALLQEVCDKDSAAYGAEPVGPLRTLLQRAALATSLALVLGATLSPADGPNHLVLAPWAATQLDAGNVIGNVALFALPAAVLWLFGWSLRRTVAAGLVLSLGIELLQLAVPGRTTATTDVLCNACYIFPTSNSSAFVTDSVVRSGLQNSTLCPSLYFTYRKGPIGKNADRKSTRLNSSH